jgi:hypothetical protein
MARPVAVLAALVLLAGTVAVRAQGVEDDLAALCIGKR